jgi:hypothetical protein
VFLTTGQLVTPNFGGSVDRLTAVGTVGPLAGTPLFLIGLLIALVAGVVATRNGLRRS